MSIGINSCNTFLFSYLWLTNNQHCMCYITIEVFNNSVLFAGDLYSALKLFRPFCRKISFMVFD